jgi:hypothetical protein
MIKPLSHAGHLVQFQPEAADDWLLARCSCGWEQATRGWMLESAQEEIQRLASDHLADVARTQPADQGP